MTKGKRKPPKLNTDGLRDGQLIFSYHDVEMELESAQAAFRSYLDPSSPDIIRGLKEELRQHRSTKSDRTFSWSTRRDAPICTQPTCKGEYEPGNKGGKTLMAKVGFKWEIRSVWSRKNKGGRNPPQHFCLNGIATVCIDIWDVNKNKSVSCWDFDVATPGSPGCFFHAQVPDKKYITEDLFTCPVPRIPIFIYTPMDALDFILGELFQDGWKYHVAEKKARFIHQNQQQKLRFERTFDWLKNTIKTCEVGSVWSHMKSQEPHVMLLLTDGAG